VSLTVAVVQFGRFIGEHSNLAYADRENDFATAVGVKLASANNLRCLHELYMLRKNHMRCPALRIPHRDVIWGAGAFPPDFERVNKIYTKKKIKWSLRNIVRLN